MKLRIDFTVLIAVDREELDMLIRGLQMIEWQDDPKKGEMERAVQMKGDLLAVRNQCDIEKNSNDNFRHQIP